MTVSRLRYTPIKAEHADVFHEILSNHEHMRFTVKKNTLAESQAYFQMLAAQWQKYGFGAWCVTEMQSAKAIGWGGIIVDEQDPGDWGPELVYFLHPAATGRGYATELGREAIRYAFTVAKLDKISAFAIPDNQASCRLLDKLGFARIGFVEELGRNYYQIRPK